METKEIIEQIAKLPVEKRMMVVEQTLKSIREMEIREKMSQAVADLHDEYYTNKELTAFTDIDFENFYETR